MQTLREKREEKELLKSKAILFKVWNNYFKSEGGVFFSFGKGDTGNSGSWFNCGEEEVKRLREAILAGNYEVKKRIGNTGKIYQHPSEWMKN